MAKKSTALVRAESASLADMEEWYRGKPVNLVLPRIEIGKLPEGTMLAVRSVQIDGHKKADVYPTEGGKGLTKHALDKIANAAGITWISEKRIDDRSHPHYCEFEVRGQVTDFDGTVRIALGTKTMDLRQDAGDGIPGRQYAACKSEAQAKKVREFMTEQCATKARNRAIASILGIRRSYSLEELANPFIIPKLVPDTSNPLAQKAVIAGMLGATDALFGREDPKVVDAEVVDENTEIAEAPADFDDDVPIDAETGELVGPPPMAEVEDDQSAAIATLYKHADDNGIKRKEWEGIAFHATNKRDYASMTADDVAALKLAIDARIANGDQP